MKRRITKNTYGSRKIQNRDHKKNCTFQRLDHETTDHQKYTWITKKTKLDQQTNFAFKNKDHIFFILWIIKRCVFGDPITHNKRCLVIRGSRD